MKKHPRPNCLKTLFCCILLWRSACFLEAADYFVDPAAGSMSNNGSSSTPWSTLEAVFAANKTFAPGDTIYLRNGYHGSPTVKGNYASEVFIRPQAGHAPTLKKLTFNAASHWDVGGLSISPENAGVVDKAVLVTVNGNCSYITVRQCHLFSASNISAWLEADWTGKAANGFSTSAPNTTFTENRLDNVNFAISVNKTAENSVISRNTVTNFMGDGMRGLADHCVFEYNTIMNSFAIDGNHDDGFQSWSGGTGGIPVGTAVVTDITLRGNIIISFIDPNQPFKGNLQGIGCFDGFFDGWLVENNLIVTDMWHGIAFYGATNCKVVNNTVMKNPIDAFGMQPWLKITAHKNGTPSTGNLCRNNLVWDLTNDSGIGTVDSNIISRDVNVNFVDYQGFNFDLRFSSAAVDAGSDTDVPAFDIDGQPRIVPTDVGAYEYQGGEEGIIAYEGFNYATNTNVATSADTPYDYGWTPTMWSGNNDIVAPGLGYSVLPVEGNALKHGSNVPSRRTIDPAAMPDGYTVTGADGVVRLGKAGTTLWMGYLVNVQGADPDGSLATSVQLIGAATGGTSKLQMGDVGTSPNWGIKGNGGEAASSVPIVTNETVFLVAKMTFVAGSNNDVMELYVNPPLGPLPPSTPSAVLTGRDIGTFHAIEFKGNRLATSDQFVLGQSWANLKHGVSDWHRPNLIAYDGFQYPISSAISGSPDSATDFGWTGTTWGGSNDVVAGLSHGVIPSQANAVRFSSNVSTPRTVDPAAIPASHAVVGSDSVTRFGKAGSTVWIRFLMRVEGADDGTKSAALTLNGSSSGGGVKLSIGDVGAPGTWSVKGSGTAQSSSTVPIVEGDTVLVVARISFVAGSANDEVDLYINPAPGATPPATPSAQLRGTDIGAFEKLDFKGSRMAVADEVAVGVDWASVAGF